MKWNASGKRLVLLWMRQIALNRMAHNNESVAQSTLGTRLAIALMIFTGSSALASVVDLISTQLPPEQRWVSTLLSVAIILSAITATILAGVIQTIKPDEKAEKNRQAAVQYNNLSNIMQRETVIDDPKPLHIFLEEIIDRFSYIQNYGSEIMKDQASTADLPNLALIKDAERRRRLRAKMAGKELSEKSAAEKSLEIVNENDVAIYDADEYSASYVYDAPQPREMRAHSAPEAVLSHDISCSKTTTSAETEEIPEPPIPMPKNADKDIFEFMSDEEEFESDNIEEDIMEQVGIYDGMKADNEKFEIVVEIPDDPPERSLLRRTQYEEEDETTSSSPKKTPVKKGADKKSKSKSNTKMKSPRADNQKMLLDRLDKAQQAKMNSLQGEILDYY